MSINISGAVDFRVIDYDNRRFVLFSDIHSGFEGLCSQQCFDSNYNFDEITLQDNVCYTVDGAIKKIIVEAKKYGEYVDVFFETNFYGEPPHRTLLIDPSDSLDLTTRAYRDCLYKGYCPYTNARFHYTDIRQGLSKSSKFLGILPNLMDSITRINKLPMFLNIQSYGNKPLNANVQNFTLSNYIYFFVDTYILGLFISSPILIDTALWKYITILLTSTNYIFDLNDFLDKLLLLDTHKINLFVTVLKKKFSTVSLNRISSTLNKLLEKTLQKVRKWSVEPTMITHRNNKIMSRVKAQLNGLNDQGDIILGEKLEQFITQKLKDVSITYLYNTLNLQYSQVLASLTSGLIKDPKKLPSVPLLHIVSFIMDLYTVARMFRVFPIQYRMKHSQNKVSSDEHIISSYVIAYEGKAHINTITDFLQSLGATINRYNPINSSPDYQRCVSILNENLLLTNNRNI